MHKSYEAVTYVENVGKLLRILFILRSVVLKRDIYSVVVRVAQTRREQQVKLDKRCQRNYTLVSHYGAEISWKAATHYTKT
jgi:hypothetical protein